jgi:hypothetical protein
MPWHVMRSRGRESRAVVDLTRKGVRAFWPKVHKYLPLARGEKEQRFRICALMPGYVFVELRSHAERDIVAGCYYAGGLLGSWTDGQFYPSVIPSQYVADLIDHGPWEIGKRHSRQPFKKGMKAKLALSRTSEIIARVEGIDSAGKVVISAELLGGVRQIHVEPERLEALAG